MPRRISVKSDELNYHEPYSFDLTERQAYQVLNARVGEEVKLSGPGAFVVISSASLIHVRTGDRGGTAALSRADVLSQINETIRKRSEAGNKRRRS